MNIEEIKAREQAATPGTWYIVPNDDGNYSIFTDVNGTPYKVGETYLRHDAEVAAHASTDIPALIKEVVYQKILESNYKRRAETAEDEVERLTAEVKCLDNEYHHYRRLSEEADQQIATLKKAYELMATAYGKYYNPYSTLEERARLLPQHMDYFMKQAQQLTHETHGESEAEK